MAINLVQVVSQFLTPDVIARFASAIGVNPTLAQTLANAALPTILASLGGAAATPAGAQRLADQIGAQDPGVIDNLAATLAGSGHASLASAGSSMLSSVLGGAGVSGVAGALARLTGAHAGQAESALGLLTPVALAAVGRQEPSTWNSGKALGDLFASQRDVIQQAMPAGLGAALGGLGVPALANFSAPAGAVRDAVASAASSAQRQAQGAAASVQSAARDTAGAAAGAARAVESGAPGWVWPAVAVVALGALAWWYMGRSPAPAPVATAPKPAVTAPAVPAPAPVQQAAPAVTAPALDVAGTAANVATASVASLQQIFAGVTDAASAKLAEPKLKDAAAQVDKASAAIMALPEAARATVATQAKPAVANLKDQVAKILAIPGVGDVLKPIVEPMMAKLSAIAGG